MNKKLNSSEKNYITKKETNITEDAKLQIRFDMVVNDFDPDDEISIKIANYEMHKNWQKFLEAGFDVALVVKMMSPADIWEHYDELLIYGAEIDIPSMFSGSAEEFFDDVFTRKHWDELAMRGVLPDILADRCYDDCCIYNIEGLEAVIDKGVSLKKAFELIEGWLEARRDRPKEWLEFLTWFYDHGFPKTDIKEWLKQHADSYTEDYIVDIGSDFYKKLDMDDGSIIDHYLDRYGYLFFSEYGLSALPNIISVDRLVNYFPMREIIENCRPYAFEDFIIDYLSIGKNIDILARKFMDEIGYSSDPSESGALLDLVYAGASTDIIDPEEYLDLVDVSQLDDSEADNWYEYFEVRGYDRQRISKFLR